MLVIHSGHDFRIPITQGLGAFTALQRRGIPSEFLHLPGREPLGAEAAQQRAVARDGECVAEEVDGQGCAGGEIDLLRESKTAASGPPFFVPGECPRSAGVHALRELLPA